MKSKEENKNVTRIKMPLKQPEVMTRLLKELDQLIEEHQKYTQNNNQGEHSG